MAPASSQQGTKGEGIFIQLPDTEYKDDHTLSTPEEAGTNNHMAEAKKHETSIQRSVDHIIKESEMDSGETQWEGPMEWTYLGHGEWGPPEESINYIEIPHIDTDPELVYKWRCTTDVDIQLHNEVITKGYPNRWGAKIPIRTKWNLEKFSQELEDYEDKEVVEWMKYGWPTGRLPTLPDPTYCTKNHKGATEHAEALTQYIAKELAREAVMGPYTKLPFQNKTGISPLSTRPKKGSEDRRIILDLSFPIGQSVNDGIPKDSYLGFMAKLSFPKVDDFAFRIHSLGEGCMMFKIDLSRYFRQLPLDPGDYSLIGYIINGQIYFDKVLPMGMRSAPYIAQRVTNAIAYIHRRMEFFLLNYVDDCGSGNQRQNLGSISGTDSIVTRTQGGHITGKNCAPNHQIGIPWNHLRLQENDHGNLTTENDGNTTRNQHMDPKDFSKKEGSGVAHRQATVPSKMYQSRTCIFI